MPVLRERKIPSEYIDQYLKMGGCSRIGAEVWYIQGKRLQIGTVQSVNEGGDTITVVSKDRSITLSPMDKILFTEPFYKIPKDLGK